MITFDDYKKMYEWKWIDKPVLGRAVTLDKITPEQYEEITGEVFTW